MDGDTNVLLQILPALVFVNIYQPRGGKLLT